jgi:predicted SAM-dependent methyltransferase
MLRRIFRSLPQAWRRAIRQARDGWQNATERRRFQRQLGSGAPLKIIVGTSGTSQPGWIASDIGYLNLLRPEHWAEHFSPASIEAILAEHVWEHLNLEEGRIAARTCHDYLKPGGYLRVAVPDGFHPDPAYRGWVRVGGVGVGADDHKVLYDHQTLGELFTQAGFEVTLLEYFDAQGKFHAMAWDPADGMIRRSQRFDARNQGGDLRYTSLILDARKPAARSA